MHYRETVLWGKAMEAAREVYRLAPLLPREETYGMRSQVTRAAVSIPAGAAIVQTALLQLRWETR